MGLSHSFFPRVFHVFLGKVFMQVLGKVLGDVLCLSRKLLVKVLGKVLVCSVLSCFRLGSIRQPETMPKCGT